MFSFLISISPLFYFNSYFATLSSTIAAFCDGVYLVYSFTGLAFCGAGVSIAGVDSGNADFESVLVSLLLLANAKLVLSAIAQTNVVIEFFIAISV